MSRLRLSRALRCEGGTSMIELVTVMLILSTIVGALTTVFVQGTRDALCPIPRLEEVRARMTAPNQLHLVEGGNHSLELPAQKKNASAQKDVTLSALEAIRRFVEELAP